MPGRQQNKNHTGEERTEFKLGGRRKNLDFLQFEGACPRNHKSENKKTLIFSLNDIYKVFVITINPIYLC